MMYLAHVVRLTSGASGSISRFVAGSTGAAEHYAVEHMVRYFFHHSSLQAASSYLTQTFIWLFILV